MRDESLYYNIFEKAAIAVFVFGALLMFFFIFFILNITVFCLQVKYNIALETKDTRTKKYSMLHALSHIVLTNERFKWTVSPTLKCPQITLLVTRM